MIVPRSICKNQENGRIAMKESALIEKLRSTIIVTTVMQWNQDPGSQEATLELQVPIYRQAIALRWSCILKRDETDHTTVSSVLARTKRRAELWYSLWINVDELTTFLLNSSSPNCCGSQNVLRDTALLHDDHHNTVNSWFEFKFSTTDQWNTIEDVAIFELFMGQK